MSKKIFPAIFCSIRMVLSYSSMIKLPDKRTLYLFYERISLGKKERLAILVLCSLIIGVETVRLAKLYVFTNRDTYDYAELNALIDKRTLQMQQSYDSLITARYNPAPIAEVVEVKVEKKSTKKTTKPKVSLGLNSLDINLADAKEWEALPRIGPKTAQAIIDKRIELGGFTAIEELLKVKGIGPKTLEQIKPYLKALE
ncbi:helix-hairpin-helix domain-containing protein [bacterium]|nr:MAG: helix-hairpin-helix domain-containing protein [bacterium]